MHISPLYAAERLVCGQQSFRYFSLARAAGDFAGLESLPFSVKILVENLFRNQPAEVARAAVQHVVASFRGHVEAFDEECAFMPSRVLMQDFTGVPAIVDLAAMRAAVQARGGDPEKVNPLVPVDLVIDHSVTVDRSGSAGALDQNTQLEYARNMERYRFLKWGQKAFRHFRVVPPGTGICHQVNLEYLAQVVTLREENGQAFLFPDTLVGTDSHTTMVNGLGVLGWGVGGIEAEAAMLGQSLSMAIPEVVGVVLKGQMREGVTATDLVLTVTQMLRQHKVVGKFVEFCGDGLQELTLADRATVANMAPEYGATCGFFPADEETLAYLRLTGRAEDHIKRTEAFLKAQGLWFSPDHIPLFHQTLTLDLGTVEPSMAGPKRPQDRVTLSQVPLSFAAAFPEAREKGEEKEPSSGGHRLRHGDVVIAAITSCTNTSNPAVMVAAGLLAHKAVQKGLRVPPWVKTSLAPGSRSVTAYLDKAGLTRDLETLGFYTVGYGCTTCIGNSGPLPESVARAVDQDDLTVAAVLSGNRNFEGRIHPQVKANYLASPPLVVACALAGHVRGDWSVEPLARTSAGDPVFLKDLWPSGEEIQEVVRACVTRDLFGDHTSCSLEGGEAWKGIAVESGSAFAFDPASTYVQCPPWFEESGDTARTADIRGARILALLGDSITTDHISPAGSIKPSSPAGLWLQERGVAPADFNAYGARRGHHEVMVRGTLANIRLQNRAVPEKTGGWARLWPEGEVVPIYDAAMHYQENRVPLVLVAGKEYGTGSSRDWAAKGTRLLGVRAVIAGSFERIHRSNLVGMGVLPLVFPEGQSAATLGLDGSETVDIQCGPLQTPRASVTVVFHRKEQTIPVICQACLNTADEIRFFHKGGILPAVLDTFLQETR